MAPGGRPPRLARLLLRISLPGTLRERVVGDLDEEYEGFVRPRRERRHAHRWYWRMTVRSIGAAWADRAGRLRGPARGRHRGRGGGGMGGFVRGLRVTGRTLARRPVFALLAVATAAVGVAAATTVFSVTNWLLLRPIPGVEEMDGLFAARLQHRDGGGTRTGISLPILREMRRAAPGVWALAGYQAVHADVHLEGLEPQRVPGHAVTEGYFDALQVTPHLGRLFTEREYVDPSLSDVAVLSERFWRTRLAAGPGVIGSTIRLNGRPLEVVGVAEPGFRGPDRLGDADFWVGAHAFPTLRHFPASWAADSLAARLFLNLVGRSNPDTELEVLDAAFSAVLARFAARYPEDVGVLESYRVQSRRSVGLDEFLVTRTVDIVGVLGAAAALLLLTACGNVANLLLVRGRRRRAEVAIRRALGASVGRIHLELFTEAGVIGALGGVVGLFMAGVGQRALSTVRLLPDAPPLGAMEIDGRVAAFTVSATLVSSILFGTLPAIVGTRGDLTGAMKAGGRTATPAGRRLRASLTSVQVALSITLLVGAALLVRSLLELRAVPLGFDPRGVSYHLVDPTSQGWSAEEILALQGELLDVLDRDARTVSVAATTARPFWIGSSTRLRPTGRDLEPVNARVVWSAGEYLETLRIPLVTGRAFSRADQEIPPRTAPGTVVVNRTLAVQVFGTVDVVGRSLEVLWGGEYAPREIIGVVEDTRYVDLENAVPPTILEPRAASRNPAFTLLVRSERPWREVDAMVRSALQELAPAVPHLEGAPLSATVDGVLADERLLARVVAVIGLLAVALATVGTYGTVSSLVAERTREIGLRAALGAPRASIVGRVVTDTAVVVLGGSVVGIGLALFASRLLEGRLFGLGAGDPTSYVAAVALVLVGGILAAWAPARAATGVDPVTALRSE